MDMSRIYSDSRQGSSAAALPGGAQAADLRVAQYLAEAAQGDASAFFDLGVTFSTGDHGIAGDLIEAHKWFNLAAVAGHDCAQSCRADISEEMTPREIAEAQRRAREWIAAMIKPGACCMDLNVMQQAPTTRLRRLVRG